MCPHPSLIEPEKIKVSFLSGKKMEAEMAEFNGQKIGIKRDVDVLTYPFKELFQGFEKVPAVRETFGKDTDKILDELKVELYSRKGYMSVSETRGNLIISSEYLRHGDDLSIYLDVIHELVHVKQFKEGKDLFDPKYHYVDRPTEIEAYAQSVGEARRLGMKDEEIMDYLRMEWVTEEEVQRLAQRIGVKGNSKPRKIEKLALRRPMR